MAGSNELCGLTVITEICKKEHIRGNAEILKQLLAEFCETPITNLIENTDVTPLGGGQFEISTIDDPMEGYIAITEDLTFYEFDGSVWTLKFAGLGGFIDTATDNGDNTYTFTSFDGNTIFTIDLNTVGANIYNSDGTLPEPRVVNLDGNTINFPNGSILSKDVVFTDAAIQVGHLGNHKYHLTVRNITDQLQSYLYIMPRQISDVGDNRLTGLTSGLKLFMEDYDQQNVDGNNYHYRDFVLSTETDGGYNGFGKNMISANTNGDYWPFHAEFVIAVTQDGSNRVLRAMRMQGSSAKKTTFHRNGPGTFYRFKEDHPIWREGLTVTEGDIVGLYGRVYEAQNSGITGSTRPIFDDVGGQVESYQGGTTVIGTSVVLNNMFLSTGTGHFQNGETITGGTSSATATVQNYYGFSSGTAELRMINITGTFQNGEIVTGGTSGASRTLDTITQSTGYTGSDDNINWLFIENLEPLVSGQPFHSVLVLGDSDTDPISGFEGTQILRDAFINGGISGGPGSRLRFISSNKTEADIWIERKSNEMILHADIVGGASGVRIESGNLFVKVDGSTGSFQIGGGPMRYAYTPDNSDNSTSSNLSLKHFMYLQPPSQRIITSVSGGVPGGVYIIRAQNSNVVLSNGSGIKTPTGADYAMSAGETLIFFQFNTEFAYLGRRNHAEITAPEYATDLDADNDANLPSGGIYALIGDRTVKRKP